MIVDAEPGPRPRRSLLRPRWYGAAMKVVRRIHMYLGLMLFPWILLYGISGMSFNHPEVGRDIDERALSHDEVTAMTGFLPWDPDAVARQVVAQLDAAAPGRYQLDGDGPRVFSGWPLLATPSKDGGRHVLIVDLNDGSATLKTHPPNPESPAAPFAAAAIALPEYRMAAVEAQMKDLLPRLGIDAPGPLRAHPKIAPELRFRIHDVQSGTWNVTYNLGTGALDGRPADADSGLRFAELLSRLHTTHHYPVHGGVTWLWALMADLVGLTLVLWALSGLAMWWQMKPTRVIGAVAIAVALVVAGLVMTGTASHIQFGNVAKDG